MVQLSIIRLVYTSNVYEIEHADKVDRVIIKTIEASPMQCTLRCKINEQCQQSGIIHDRNGNTKCVLYGAKTVPEDMIDGEIDSIDLIKKIGIVICYKVSRIPFQIFLFIFRNIRGCIR